MEVFGNVLAPTVHAHMIDMAFNLLFSRQHGMDYFYNATNVTLNIKYRAARHRLSKLLKRSLKDVEVGKQQNLDGRIEYCTIIVYISQLS